MPTATVTRLTQPAATAPRADAATVAETEAASDTGLPTEALEAMRRAAEFYRGQVATHGGYVYFYSLDLSVRWGEGAATTDQVWVQPPGTPTVGLAYVEAYRATGEQFFLDAAVDAAEALVYGQLESGGWTNCIDFDPNGERTAQYRNGGGRGKNNSSFDDGQSQSAIRLLVNTDAVTDFAHAEIHEAARVALDAVLAAQFPNGAFPQVWTGPVASQPSSIRASYPEHDWETEGRIKEYWTMYTLNDDVCGYLAQTLIDAHKVYNDDRYLESLQRLGDFLLLAQMPDPQPGWAQQYNYEMNPIWARKFEPPAVAGDETQEAIETLMQIAVTTGDDRYLAPIPRALEWLRSSLLPDGQLARYYELRTNTPLYMFRRGDVYTLTHDDSNLPGHYGWKIAARLDELEQEFNRLSDGAATDGESTAVSEDDVREIIAALDDEGRWLATYAGEKLVGQGRFQEGEQYLSSELFSENMMTLSRYIKSADASR